PENEKHLLSLPHKHLYSASGWLLHSRGSAINSQFLPSLYQCNKAQIDANSPRHLLSPENILHLPPPLLSLLLHFLKRKRRFELREYYYLHLTPKKAEQNNPLLKA